MPSKRTNVTPVNLRFLAIAEARNPDSTFGVVHTLSEIARDHGAELDPVMLWGVFAQAHPGLSWMFVDVTPEDRERAWRVVRDYERSWGVEPCEPVTSWLPGGARGTARRRRA